MAFAQQKFISQPIQVSSDDLEPTQAMGEPGAPRRFRWHGGEIVVSRVVSRWRETRDCTHGSGEQYAFKHWFDIEANDGRRMKIYFERKPRSKSQAKKRWWLFSIDQPT